MNSIPRVAYLCDGPFVGGAERSLARMIESLTARGAALSLVRPEIGDFAMLAKAMPIRQLALAQGPALPRSLRRMVANTWRTYRFVTREESRVVHANDIGVAPLAKAAAWPGGLRVVCHVRYAYEPDGLRYWLRWGFDRAVFVSRFMCREVTRECPDLFPEGSTVVIPNGFTAPPTPSRSTLEALRNNLSLRSGRLVVGFFGQIIHVKGLDLLLHAVASSPHLSSEVQLLVVGDDKQSGGQHRAAMEALARELGVANSCRFTGFRDDVWALMHLCDIVVVPSRVEPFGNVAMEAMAAGVPVVAADTGGLPEIVSLAHGRLVKSGDVRALRAMIESLISNHQLRQGLAAGAAEHARVHFSLDAQAASLEHLYRTLTQGVA